MALETPIEPVKSTARLPDLVKAFNALAAQFNALQREAGAGRPAADQAGRPTVRCKVTGRATQAGRYTLKIFNSDIDTTKSKTDDLDEADFGTLPDDDNAVGWFAGDLGGGWSLATDAVESGEVIGKDEDGLSVVSLYGGGGGASVLYHCTLAPGSGTSLGSQTTLPDKRYLITLNGVDYSGEKLPEFFDHQYGEATGFPITGTCYFDANGDIHLLQAHYVWKVDPCIAPP